MVIAKILGDWNAYMAGGQARNEALGNFVKVFFENFPRNCKSIQLSLIGIMDIGHYTRMWKGLQYIVTFVVNVFARSQTNPRKVIQGTRSTRILS